MKLPVFFSVHSQGLLVALVFVIGLTSAVLGTLQLRSSIYAPFAISQTVADIGTSAQVSADALKQKDTDGDKLSDYDELNVYGTSPYLTDSDSDSIVDATEVKNGTDPNCPQGKTCNAAATPPSSSVPSSVTLPPALSANPTAADLRSILKQSGLSASQVDAMSDAAVQAMYAEAVASTKANQPGGAGATPVAPVAPTPIQSAAEIRQLLIKNGVPADKLKNVSDEDLLKTYQQTLNQLQNNTTPSTPAR